MQRHKLTMALATTCLMTLVPAFAAVNGPYIGLGLGYGILRTPNTQIFTGTTTNSNARGGWGGRGFVGFNISPWLGIEGGYAGYPTSYYKAGLNDSHSLLSYKAHAFDLVGKAYLPLGCQFNLYALAGAAYFIQTMKFNDAGFALVSPYQTPTAGNTHTRKTRPLFGAGASFDVTPSFTTRIEWTRIQGLGDFHTRPNTAIPNTDLATLSAVYNFG